MELRRMGDSGLWVSAVGLGCNNFGMRIDQAATKAVVDAAIDAGITFFDTADVYGGASGSPRRCSARRCRAGATRWCSPPSSADADGGRHRPDRRLAALHD